MGQPITWKNVGATVSGSAAGKTMEGGVKTIMGAFDPAKRLLKEAEDIEKQNLEQTGINLNLAEQDRVRDIGSLAEYNRMREAGELDPGEARERVGFMYDAEATQKAQEDQLGRLRQKATGAAMTAGNLAGDEELSSLAGTEAYGDKLRELGASEPFIRESSADYMSKDKLNAAQYAEQITKTTTSTMTGKKFTSNAEIEDYLVEQKGIHGNAFDVNQARIAAKNQMQGGFQDKDRIEANEIKARKKAIDQFAGIAMSAFTTGKSFDDVKVMIASLPKDQQVEALERATAIEASVNNLTESDRVEMTYNQQVADNMGTDLKVTQSNEMGKLQAQITALDLAPTPAIQGAVAKLSASMGVGSEIEARYEKGLAAGVLNAIWAGVGKQTGTKVGQTVKTKLNRLLLDSPLTRDEAAGIIFTAEQYARESGGLGTEKFDNETFEAMVSKMHKDVLKAKQLKSEQVILQDEHDTQSSAYRSAKAEWQKNTTLNLLGTGKTAPKAFTFSAKPITPTGVSEEVAIKKLMAGSGGQINDPAESALTNTKAEAKLLKAAENKAKTELGKDPKNWQVSYEPSSGQMYDQPDLTEQVETFKKDTKKVGNILKAIASGLQNKKNQATGAGRKLFGKALDTQKKSYDDFVKSDIYITVNGKKRLMTTAEASLYQKAHKQ